MEKRPRIISLNTKLKAAKKKPWYAAFTVGKMITPNEDLWDGEDDDVMYFSEFIDYRIRSTYLTEDGIWHCELMNEQGNIMDVDSDGWLTDFKIVE